MAASTNNYGFPYPQDSDIVDVAGDIQSLAEDIDSKLSEAIADTVGLMVTSNTENGITVTYDDADNTLDFNVPAFDITFLGDISGTGNILNLGSASAVITVIDDSHNHSSATISDFAEAVADTVGNMVNSNTENGISVTYDDTDNTLDFDVNDFNIVLSGDVSGSATVTNLASINISASVADNSHNHTSSNITDFESSVQSVTDSFTTVNVPSGTDPLATLYNDTLTITENNGILITGTGSNTLNVSTNATFNNTASALVSRDSNRTFDITAIDFDISASAAPQVGRLHWSDDEGTLSTLLKNGNIELAIGQKEVALCYNGSGSPMTKGQVVYISGAQGQKPSILLSSSSSETSSSKTFGVVAEPIANGEEGFVTTFGVLKDLNTSSYSEGAALWLSTVAGEITTTMPTQPNHAVFIGYCVRQHASAGQIFIKIQNGYEIEELHNVLITSASAGDVLIYNSASALWINENFNERAQDAIATMISNGTQNNITVSYNDGSNSLSFSVSDSASTNVQGTANEIEVTSASNIFTVGLPNNVTISNDLTVSGNMTVSGSTTYLNTTELLVEDNLVTLNSGEIGSPSLNAGIEIERGTSANTSIRWNESTDVWEFTNDGTTFYTIKDFDTALATKTTDNLTQGSTNLYFTDERAQDAISTAIAAGTQTNITVSYDDSTNSFSFVSVDPGVTSLAGTADEVTVSASAGAVTLSLPATINANTTGTAAALTTARTIELTGDVTGSVSFDGSASASIVTTVVSGGGGGGVTSLLGTADEVTVSASVGAVTLSLPSTISQNKIANLTSDLSAKAPLASPTFTGVPAAPTAAGDTNTTQVATTAYVVGQGYLKSATASAAYQPANTNLTSIAALASASGGFVSVTPESTSETAWTTVTSNYGTDELRTVAYGNGTWVAGGLGNSLRTSTNGTNWTTSVALELSLAVAYGNGTWVGTNYYGVIRTSTDTTTWTTQTSNFGGSVIASIGYGNGAWVAGGYYGKMRTSTNTTTWTTVTSNFGSSSIFSVAYGNGKWVATGAGGAIRTSTDTVTWTTVTSGVSYPLYSIAYANGVWVAGGYQASMTTSTDAVTWTTRSPSFLNRPIFSVAYVNNLWTAVGSEGRMSTSIDAITWTTVNSGFGTTLKSIAYGNNTAVVVGISGRIGTKQFTYTPTSWQASNLSTIYAPLASPALTGTPTSTTASVDTNTTQIATTAYVVGQGYLKSSSASTTYAPLASPTLTGVPAAPTAALGTNTTQIATTAFVKAETAALVDAAPATLDTLNELAAALGDDANFATTVTNTLANKLDISSASSTYLTQTSASTIYAPLASPTLTGIPAAPTASVDTNTTQVATTAYVVGQDYLKSSSASTTYAPLASPTLTGTPAAPTAAAGTNTTQLATTAFVQNSANTVVIDTKTDSYTLLLTDAGETIEMNSASANTVTIPLNSSVEFAIGTTLDIIQYGAGQTTIVATGGVTLRSKGGALKLTGQYSGATLYKRGTDEWVVVGDLTV